MIFSGYRNVYSTLVWYHRVLCSRNHTILHNPSSFLPEHSTTRTCSHPRPHNRTPASATNIRCCSYCPLQLHNRQPSFDIFSLTTPLVVSLYSVRCLICLVASAQSAPSKFRFHHKHTLLLILPPQLHNRPTPFDNFSSLNSTGLVAFSLLRFATRSTDSRFSQSVYQKSLCPIRGLVAIRSDLALLSLL
jgi:hypothetical protein